MNTTLLSMMALVVIGAGAFFYFNRTAFANSMGKWGSLLGIPLMILPGALIVGLAFALSHGSATSDTEIWSGAVTGKARVHGTYEKPYDCRCRSVQSCTGSGKDRSCSSRQVCDTCYETRYTVKWNCQTTIGGYTIDSEDSSWRAVYSKPDPARFTSINVGDPVSKTNTYTNYVQAVPESLFKPGSESIRAKYAKMTPAYPDKIYDIYKIDRFVQVGFAFTDAAAWNLDISNMLRTLGPKKQANVIVVVAKTNDPNYMYAIRDAWEGANKNDVVLLIGSEDGQKIAWVDVISWTKRELFKVQLRDEVLALGTIDRTKIMPIVQRQIETNFERRRMREFEYLSNEIDPPTWLLGTLGVVLVVGYGGMAWYLNRVARPMPGRRRYTNSSGPM
jgi:hypothetical protein